MWNLKNKINEHTKLKQTNRYREQTNGCQIGEGLGEEGEGIKKLQNSHGGVKYKWGIQSIL